MPATQKAGSTKKSTSTPMFKKASMKEFGGGRWEGGIGTVIDGVFAPWKYPGSESKKCTLFSLITIRDEAGDDHVIPYQAGFFGETDPKKPGFYNNSYPSKDEVTPAGPEDMELEELLEVYAKLAAGEVELTEEEEKDYQGVSVVFRTDPENPDRISRLPKKDWVQLIQSVEALPEFQDENGNSTFETTDNADMFNGYKFNWAWVDQKFTSKRMREKGSKFEVLVPLQSFGRDEEWEEEMGEQAEEEAPVTATRTAASKAGAGAKKGAPSASARKTAKAAVVEEEEEEDVEGGEEDIEEEDDVTGDDEGDELGDRVDAAILSALVKLGRSAVKREFNAVVVKTFPPSEQVEVMNSYLNNNKWMTSPDRSFTYKDGKWSA